MAQFFDSIRGGKKMSHEGFLYIIHRSDEDKIAWRCVDYQKSCKGRVHQKADNIIQIIEHNHLPNPVAAGTAQLSSRIKNVAKQDRGNQPRTIVNECLAGVSDHVLVAMPKIVSLEKKRLVVLVKMLDLR